MEDKMYFLGLPFKTWLIVGGLFVLSVLSPAITAIILSLRKDSKNE
ncbi:MAG: hypothetical protein PWQ37_583 [Candidatus Petromonas sp.]|jgi:hypothetical protein|nr:hypothetical protein [Candidatus Petromonas sp.]